MNNKLKHRLNPMIATLFPDCKWKTMTHHILSPCPKAWGQLQVFSECLFEEPFVLERESWVCSGERILGTIIFEHLFFMLKLACKFRHTDSLSIPTVSETAWIVNRQYLRITLLLVQICSCLIDIEGCPERGPSSTLSRSFSTASTTHNRHSSL